MAGGTVWGSFFREKQRQKKLQGLADKVYRQFLEYDDIVKKGKSSIQDIMNHLKTEIDANITSLIKSLEHVYAVTAQDIVKAAKFVEHSVLPALQKAEANASTIESITSLKYKKS